MKILHVIGGSKFGGDSVLVCEWIKFLMRRGHDVTLLASDPEVVAFAENMNIKVWQFDGIQRKINPLRDLYAVLKLSCYIRHGYDLVHTHTTKGGLVGRLAAYIAGTPIIIHTVHGFAFHQFSSKTFTKFVSLVEKLGSKISSHVVFVNKHDRQDAIAKKIVQECKSSTIHNAISIDRLKLGQPPKGPAWAAWKSSQTKKIIVTVGRLAEQKGLVYLLQAIKILSYECPELDYKLILVGDGELRKELNDYTVEHKLSDYVDFVGFQADPISWLKIADIFILSSLWEGHSITLLEAMACGCPIIATSIKGNVESVNNGVDGILVEPKNPSAIAASIRRLLEDRELAMLYAEQAKRTFYENFTLQTNHTKYLNLYERMVGKTL